MHQIAGFAKKVESGRQQFGSVLHCQPTKKGSLPIKAIAFGIESPVKPTQAVLAFQYSNLKGLVLAYTNPFFFSLYDNAKLNLKQWKTLLVLIGV